MTWDKYDKSIVEQLKNSPVIINAINDMRDKGHTKEYTQKITGAPFEVVDRIFANKKKGSREPVQED